MKNKLLIISLVVATLLVIVIGILSYYYSNERISTTRWVEHTNKVIDEAQQSLSLVKDIESGTRNYLVTGDTDYLDYFKDAEKSLPEHITQLKLLTKDNTSQQEKVDSLSELVDHHLSYSTQSIRLKRDSPLQAMPLVKDNRDKLYSDSIRGIIADLDDEEHDLLKKREQDHDKSIAAFNRVALVFLVSAFIILLVMLISVRNNIRIRKKGEEDLRFLSRQIDQSNDAIFTVDAQRHVKSWNKGAQKLYGFSSEEIMGKDANVELRTDVTDEELNKLLEEIVRQDYWSGELRRRTRDGRDIFVRSSTTTLKDEKGNITGYVAVSFDITAEKELREQLKRYSEDLEMKVEERTEEIRRNEKQFRHTLDSMMEGAQIIGFDWRYKYVNDALAKHARYSKEELLGYTVQEKFPGIEQTETYKAYVKCFEERVSIHTENEFEFPDGSKGWFELSYQPVPEGIFILSMDITERKRAEQAILGMNLELEKRVASRTAALKRTNEELEAFSYSVSHDLRAPLRGIIGFSTILEEDYGRHLDAEAKRVIAVIKANTSRMGQLIDDLLSFSRMARHEMLKTDINMENIVKELVAGVDPQQGKWPIEWEIGNLPDAYGDINSIRQAWVNLVSNAVKYSRNSQPPRIRIGSYKDSGGLVYFIEDNGVGFDDKYKEKLFKVFQRLHGNHEFEGTGVGLALVEKIISKHGGRISTKAEVNKGATFFFNLPAG